MLKSFALRMRWSVKPRCHAGRFGGEGVREASFEELHGAFEGDGLWGDEQVDVAGHEA